MNNENRHFLMIEAEKVKSIRDIAVESLREAIISGKLKPGDHLKERELSQAMGVSTTPIKEALRILGHEGLVETIPRKGTFVSELVNTTIEETLMLRASLEGLCARLAAIKITPEELKALEQKVTLMESLKETAPDQLVHENTAFHTMIRQIAKNPMIYNILLNISAFDTAFRKRALQYRVEVQEGYVEHREIFEAIRQGDPDLAEMRMKKHIMRTTENVLRMNVQARGDKDGEA
ncbi:GntR family transcriptional regulator [Brevibacillus sp. TJ4]|uniref:GntR family transcriptional regulator n=1 Tax=Brevibacillus sp. TJ4 TaxID=3234853 RepID=UPI003BA222F3